MREVDRRGLLGQDLHAAAGVIVALLERRQGVQGRALEAQLGAQAGPVEFGGCAALEEGVSGVDGGQLLMLREI